MSNQQKLLLKSKSAGDFLLQQQKRNEWGAKQREIEKQETVQNCSLLRRKKTVVKKVEPKLDEGTRDPWDKFRMVRWSLKKPNGKPHPFMTDINIWNRSRNRLISH